MTTIRTIALAAAAVACLSATACKKAENNTMTNFTDY